MSIFSAGADSSTGWVDPVLTSLLKSIAQKKEKVRANTEPPFPAEKPGRRLWLCSMNSGAPTGAEAAGECSVRDLQPWTSCLCPKQPLLHARIQNIIVWLVGFSTLHHFKLVTWEMCLALAGFLSGRNMLPETAPWLIRANVIKLPSPGNCSLNRKCWQFLTWVLQKALIKYLK